MSVVEAFLISSSVATWNLLILVPTPCQVSLEICSWVRDVVRFSLEKSGSRAGALAASRGNPPKEDAFLTFLGTFCYRLFAILAKPEGGQLSAQHSQVWRILQSLL